VKTTIYNIGHFKDAVKFARKLGGESKRSFLECLQTLNRIRKNNAYSLEIGQDWVEHSFWFAFRKSNELAFNGGMILHGFQETLSIELESANHPHWSIHT
jgi:hypothetical protein